MRLLVTLAFFFSVSGSLTPAQFFGESFTDAVSFYRNNRSYYEHFFRSYGLDANLAAAVVFPETVRYNRFCDFVETTALEVAYVSGGKSLSDFSIGRFQMKPSFVEELERRVASNPASLAKYQEIIDYEGCTNPSEIRKSRLMRLRQFRWQMVYLACFISVANIQYAKELQTQPNEALLILSSAYNLGLSADFTALVRVANTKSFPYGNPHEGRFSYYDVANFFYHNYTL